MATKRSRISSSAVLNEIRSPEHRHAAVKVAKWSSEDRARPTAVGTGQGQIGNFLDRCFLCKKKIAENDAVFMYSSYAFCTSECREYQIGKDKLAEQASRRSNPARNTCDARKIMENPVATQPGKNATRKFYI